MPKRIIGLSDAKIRKAKPQETKSTLFDGGGLFLLVNGRRGVTASSALALGEAFGTGPEFWLNLQRDWDLWHALRKHEPVRALKKAS